MVLTSEYIVLIQLVHREKNNKIRYFFSDMKMNYKFLSF